MAFFSSTGDLTVLLVADGDEARTETDMGLSI